MKKLARVGLTILAFVIVVLAVSVLGVSADDVSSFCAGEDSFVVRDQAEVLPDPECLGGIYLLDIENVRSRFAVFAEAEAFRGGRDGTYWYESEDAAATSAPTATAVPTSVPTAVAVVNDHWSRLKQLDPIFRSAGLEAWLQAAGLSWTSLSADARQIEEETSPDSQILASGIQVKAVGLVVNYPVCVTTDDPSEVTIGLSTRSFRPDQRNPSTLYTNVTSTGTVTIWVDCSNWGQLAPSDDTVAPAGATPTVSEPGLDVDEDVAGEVSWLRQMLSLLQMRLEELLGSAR